MSSQHGPYLFDPFQDDPPGCPICGEVESQAIDEAVAEAIEERHAPDGQVMAAPRIRALEKYCKRCNGYGRIGKMFFAGIKPCPDCGGTGIALPPEPEWESDLWDAADEAYERAVDRNLAS